MSVGLAVFGRVPQPGRVKTRLAAQIGAERACALYAAFLQDTCALCRDLPGYTLWVDGDPDDPGLDALALPGPRRRQSAGDLGERMARALGAELVQHGRVLLVGSDAPGLPAAYLHLAAAALREAALVLGPALDGGYYLIGARRDAGPRLPELLRDVRWSSPHALADTEAAARRLGLTTARLPPWYDVDDGTGLALLRLQLALSPSTAPATAAAVWAAGGKRASF